MLENPSKSLEKAGAAMPSAATDIARAQDLVRGIAAPAQVGDSAKAQLTRAFRRISRHLPAITFRRVKSLWYGEARRIEAMEMEALQLLTQEREKHAAFLEENKRLAAALAAPPPPDAGIAGAQQRCPHCRMDRARADRND